MNQKGIIALGIPFILLLIFALFIFLLIFSGTIKNLLQQPNQTTQIKQPAVSLQTQYQNPFDISSQYVNPFSTYKNPFDTLK